MSYVTLDLLQVFLYHISNKEIPEEEQKKLRKGFDNSNQIFKKGRSEHLKYKLNREKPISLVKTETK